MLYSCNLNKIAVPLKVTVITLFLISGCSNTVPNCSDSDAKNLVTKIYTTKLQDALLYNAILIQLGMNPKLQGNPTYEQWNKLKEKNVDIKRIIDYVDQKIAEASIELTGIRTNEKDEKARKAECGGTFVSSNGKKVSAEYSVQYTEDGQIYAEIGDLTQTQ